MKKWYGSFSIMVLAFLTFHCFGCAGGEYVFPDESWERKSAEWAGFPRGSIEKAVANSAQAASALTSLTIIKEGYLVYEALRGLEPGEMTALYSATKSINSLVTGIAIDRRILSDEYASLGENLPGYQINDPLMGSITAKDILTMRTGIDYNEWNLGYNDPRNPYREWLASDDRIAYILERPMAEEPGSVFRYQTPASQLLTRMVEEAAGRDFVSLAGELLFEPLGIPADRYLWRLDKTGHARVAACNMVPSDLARIGLLVLRNGKWRGETIVSQEWIGKSWLPSLSIRPGLDFGYHWWLRRAAGREIIGAEGYGGQCLYIIPDHDMVVVVTGDFRRGPEDAFDFLSGELLPLLE